MYDKMFKLKTKNNNIIENGIIQFNKELKVIDDTNASCGRSTGFFVYLVVKNLFPLHNIILVNFNRKNNEKYSISNYELLHNIADEEKYFEKIKANKINIG
jgi:hypothetical protein